MRDSGDPSREGDGIFVPSRAWLKARAALGLSWSPSWLCPATFPCLGNKIRSRFPVDDLLSHPELLQGRGARAGGVPGCWRGAARELQVPWADSWDTAPGPVPKRDAPPPSIGKHPGTGNDRYPSVPTTSFYGDSASGVGLVRGCPSAPARLGRLHSNGAGLCAPTGIASLALVTAMEHVGQREGCAGCVDSGQAGVSPQLSSVGAGVPQYMQELCCSEQHHWGLYTG